MGNASLVPVPQQRIVIMPWFVKIERGIVDRDTFDRQVPAHQVYVQDLITKGHKAKTGYWGDFGGGMLLFHAASLDEARQLVKPAFYR